MWVAGRRASDWYTGGFNSGNDVIGPPRNADERGWMEMLVPAMTLLVFQRPNVCAPFTGHFRLISQGPAALAW